MSADDPVRRALRRVSQRMQGLLTSPNPRAPQEGRTEGWEALHEPIPGHTTIDGVPVPVVALRRNSALDQLEVVRGLGREPAWPDAASAAAGQRHVVPALSFIPHPRRELLIDGERFFFGSVRNSVRCNACGGGLDGFGFVASGAQDQADEGAAVRHSTLCERCATERAGEATAQTPTSTADVQA
jgi:hypothetical protein